MLVHAIMAGGMGSRLFGPVGGLKALVPLDNDYLLVDYILAEGRALHADLCVVSISDQGQPIVNHLRAKLQVEVQFAHQDFPGTGGAVSALLKKAPIGASIFLTTSDLYGDPGAISSVLGKAKPLLMSADPVCIIAVSSWREDDESPIYVHMSSLGDEPTRVALYGKDVAPSQYVFSGARILNSAFSRFVMDIIQAYPGLTDTQLMKRAVAGGAKIFAAHTPSVFDVDDSQALTLAQEYYQRRSDRP